MSLPRIGDYAEDESLSAEGWRFLRDALLAPLPPQMEFLSISVPAPIEAPEKFLRLVDRGRGFLWRSPNGEQFAGGGAAAEVTVSGPDRFAKLPVKVRELFDRVHARAFPFPAPPPMLVGGAAFAPGVAAHAPWDEFAEDAFLLPRWGYRRYRGSAVITLTVRADEVDSPRKVDLLVEETRALTRAFEYEAPTSMIERVDLALASIRHLPPDEWKTYIDAIHQVIRSGEFKKIVAARRCVVDLDRALEVTGFMARVFAAYPDCIHYAICRANSTFLGATPETLFRKRGLKLETMALAGTTRVKDDPTVESSRDVAALQSSEKDLGEHALVVEKILSELEPLAKSIESAAAPSTRQVRNLIHLQTPISGELREETTVFDLLAALHPTPAVGGFPAREAAEWIVQNEPLERGWYAGTVGWIDASGDGDFAVAIRCGVLQGSRAYIYAGAGIVEASDAAAEYAETGAKMAPLLRALGVVF